MCVNDDKLTTILHYESIDLVKNIYTNITEHYAQHLRKFVYTKFEYKKKISENKNNKERMKEIRKEFSFIIQDITNVINDELISPNQYHDWILQNKFLLIPRKDKYRENSIYYDVYCSHHDYLLCMIYINRELEQLSLFNPGIHLFNALPLRRSTIPHYITINTSVLINLFSKENKLHLLKHINENKDIIWNKYFYIKGIAFKKKELPIQLYDQNKWYWSLCHS